MVSRILVIAMVLGVGGAVAAQTPVDPPVSPDTLRQVQIFENNLRTAIEGAGGRLAERARQVVSDISLRFETQPRVTGAPMPNGEGVVFFIEMPAIEATSAQLWDIMYRRAQPPGQSPRVANPAGPGMVAAMITAPDPVLAPMTNPEREYSEYTRQALLDAMLDNAFALPIKEGQTLTLIVGVVSGGPINPLEAVPKKLYLRMKGDDLIALRQNRITRDEAKKRILESRY